MLSVPREPGTYRLSLSRNATFVIEAPTQTTDNLVATRGALIVDAVSGGHIQARAQIEFDAKNSVAGEFHAQICP